jgi:hypothetical protein
MKYVSYARECLIHPWYGGRLVIRPQKTFFVKRIRTVGYSSAIISSIQTDSSEWLWKDISLVSIQYNMVYLGPCYDMLTLQLLGKQTTPESVTLIVSGVE